MTRLLCKVSVQQNSKSSSTLRIYLLFDNVIHPVNCQEGEKTKLITICLTEEQSLITDSPRTPAVQAAARQLGSYPSTLRSTSACHSTHTESQREAAPQLFTRAYMWAVDWLPGDNEVRWWGWLAWTQAQVEKQGLKVSALRLPEVHRWHMNKPWAISLRTDRISLNWEHTNQQGAYDLSLEDERTRPHPQA